MKNLMEPAPDQRSWYPASFKVIRIHSSEKAQKNFITLLNKPRLGVEARIEHIRVAFNSYSGWCSHVGSLVYGTSSALSDCGGGRYVASPPWAMMIHG